MKSTIHASESQAETEERRGIFRRRRATHGGVPTPGTPPHDGSVEGDVAEVDAIARRMSELSGQPAPATPAPAAAPAATAAPTRSAAPLPAQPPTEELDVQRQLDLQRAAIARANRSAAAPTRLPQHTAPAPQATSPTPTPEPARTTSEITMPDTDLTPSTPAHVEEDDIQARMDAVLAPTLAPVTLTATTETVSPVPAPNPQQQQKAPSPTASQAPAKQPPVAAVRPTAASAPTAASLLGIDVERMVALLEDEARAAQQRIELEVRSAHAQAAEIVANAESEAERIREHGQSQARVLLGEVEEIISEAQATGEQILVRANEEAGTLRSDATAVLHQAQAEARAIVETARREGEQVLAEQRRLATVRAQEAMREQDRLKDQIRRLEERRRQVLESLEPLIAQLTQMMPAQAAAPATNPVRGGNVVQLDRTRGAN